MKKRIISILLSAIMTTSILGFNTTQVRATQLDESIVSMDENQVDDQEMLDEEYDSEIAEITNETENTAEETAEEILDEEYETTEEITTEDATSLEDDVENIDAARNVVLNSTNFPDNTFRAQLKEKYDDNNDNIIDVSSIKTVSVYAYADVPVKSIKGIELFYNLEELWIYDANLTSIDISKNTKLKSLTADYNNFANLDLSKNINLQNLSCTNNNLNTIDLSNNVKLTVAVLSDNNLTKIDLGKNVNLEYLKVDSNKLSKLNVSNNTKLESLFCSDNLLENLDLSKNANLIELDCSRNKLSGLDLSKNVNLEEISCSWNKLSSLDLGKNKKVKELYCNNNGLWALDISNISDGGVVVCENNHITKLLLRKNATLMDLKCSNNKLKNLDLSGCNLVGLYCSNNNMETININSASSLNTIECENNLLKILDLSNCENVQSIFCKNNKLEELKISKKATIYEMDCRNNYLSKLNYRSILDVNPEYYAPREMECVCEHDNNRLITWSGTQSIPASMFSTAKQGKFDLSEFGSIKMSAIKNLKGATISGKYLVLNDEGRANNMITFEMNGIHSIVGIASDTKSDASIGYKTHIQTYGWEKSLKYNGALSGTTGEAKRLEAIQINIVGNKNLGVQYTTHCQTYGWLAWSCNGEISGTTGEAKRLEAIKINLTGADKDKYDIYYRVHVQSYGWLGWAKNGEAAGTAGFAKRLEGIQIKLVKKGEKINVKEGGIVSNDSRSYIGWDGKTPKVGGSDVPHVSYKTHVQSYGWQNWVSDGAVAGTTGQSKRLEAMQIKLSNCPYSGGIEYNAHVQSYGWEYYETQLPRTEKDRPRKDGEISGTTGKAKRLEAIRMSLTGDMNKYYDIYYRVHVQSYGWMAWTKNGAVAGTTGMAKRIEGIQIVLVKKGDKAPASNYGGVVTNYNQAAIEMFQHK